MQSFGSIDSTLDDLSLGTLMQQSKQNRQRTVVFRYIRKQTT